MAVAAMDDMDRFAGVIALAAMSIQGALFSPYSRLDLSRDFSEPLAPYLLAANRDAHQYLLDLSSEAMNAPELTEAGRRRMEIRDWLSRVPYVFTAGAPDGPADLMATVDNQTVTTTIEIGTLPFTDDPLVAGVTPVREVHITELQVRINGVRAQLEMTATTFTPITSGMLIAAAHILELRTALAEAYVDAGMSAPTYTDDPLPGSIIRASDIAEVRTAVVAME